MNSIKKITTILTAIILTIGISSKAEAQVLPEFGVKGGVNHATVNNLRGSNYKTGLLLGAFLNLNIPASPLSIQPELLYVQYGRNDATTQRNITLNYIQIPVLLKFGIPVSFAKPNVFFGPYLGFNTKAESDDGNTTTTNIDEFVKDKDFGVVVGVGIDIKRLRVNLRYTTGLSSLYVDNFDDGEKNGALALTVGIAF